MANEKSCIGCKFLYRWDSGYSNYTVESTEVHCAKKRNPNLPTDKPYDWNQKDDNWPATNEARCDLYSPGETITLDVDGEDRIDSLTSDAEQIAAIRADSGRE